MRKLISLLLAVVLFSGLSSASAMSNAERTYQIEVIIFSHIMAQGLRSERWPWTPTSYIPSNRSQMLSSLQRNYFILASEQRQLEKHKNYRVLMHFAWRQKIARPRNAQPIHIFGGNIYNSSGSVIGTATYGNQPYNSENIWQVNGTITPTLIRYINIKFNLLFAQPLATLPGANRNNNIQGNFAYFRLNQSRRMRSRELNYIAHPLYGVLIKVVPIG